MSDCDPSAIESQERVSKRTRRGIAFVIASTLASIGAGVATYGYTAMAHGMYTDPSWFGFIAGAVATIWVVYLLVGSFDSPPLSGDYAWFLVAMFIIAFYALPSVFVLSVPAVNAVLSIPMGGPHPLWFLASIMTGFAFCFVLWMGYLFFGAGMSLLADQKWAEPLFNWLFDRFERFIG